MIVHYNSRVLPKPCRPLQPFPDLSAWATNVALSASTTSRCAFTTRGACDGTTSIEACASNRSLASHPARNTAIRNRLPNVPKFTTARKATTTRRVLTTARPSCARCPAATPCKFNAAAAINRTDALGLRAGRACSFGGDTWVVMEVCYPNQPGSSIASCSVQCLAWCVAAAPARPAPGLQFPMWASFSVSGTGEFAVGVCQCGQKCYAFNDPSSTPVANFAFEIPGGCTAL
ncbi:hypothetical protein DFJ74DRAFT_477787 [Hyaloraphidium curvatum]|nr:hypothetical protein DFJ74DRAFT_477787 [Hyaloraphidium curvatum]